MWEPTGTELKTGAEQKCCRNHGRMGISPFELHSFKEKAAASPCLHPSALALCQPQVTGLNMEQGKENPLLAPKRADVHMDVHACASPAPLCLSLCSRAQRSKASPWMFSTSPSEKVTEVVQKQLKHFSFP